jgi:hypothetical protein
LERKNEFCRILRGAEVKKTKATRIVISMTLLFIMCMAVAPSLADSPKKISVTISRSGPYGVPDSDAWVSEGGIRHVRGERLGLTSYAVKEGSTILFSGSILSIWYYNFNVETGAGAGHSDTVITLPSGDMFVGKITSQGAFKIAPSGGTQGISVKSQGVFHGTGDYKGWTFQYFSETGQPTEAYLLIP